MTILNAIDSGIRRSDNKKKYTATFLTGALMALAMPPVGFFPILFICAPAFVLLTYHTETKKSAFLTGWLFGLGYFVFGLYWISAALFIDIARWGWLLPFALLGLPSVLALYYGFIPLLARRYRSNRAIYALAIAIIWAGMEYLRGVLFTGFPWNLPGYSWMHAPPVMQLSAYIGIYGLTFITLIWSMALLWNTRTKAIIAGTFSIVVLLGFLRLGLNPPAATEHIIRIVQPNVSQTLKWEPEEDWKNLQKHAALTTTDPATFVIWPETAVTNDMNRYPEIARYIAAHLPRGSHGILGTLRYTTDKDGNLQFYNSVSILNDQGHVLESYDKHHLVPFGEYFPFRKLIDITPVASAIAGLSDFTPGPGPESLKTNNIPKFSPLICYEVIFPRRVIDKNNRPEWMVNVTNDGWYGNTSGPYQHFEIARVRTIEEGLPLARAANTGISAMIDPMGRILTVKKLGAAGRIDSPLPKALPPTLYSRAGDTLFFLMLMTGLFFVERKVSQG